MYEVEIRDDVSEPERRLYRSTNYLAYTWQPHPNIFFSGVTYGQFDTSDWANYRVLSENDCHLTVTDRLGVNFGYKYRFDSQPISLLTNHDSEFRSGITLSF